MRLEPVTPRIKDWTFSSAASKAGLSDLDEKKCLDAMLEFNERVRACHSSHRRILDECDRCALPAGLLGHAHALQLMQQLGPSVHAL